MANTVKITTPFHGHLAHIGFGPINNPIEADAAIVGMLKAQGYPITIVEDAKEELVQQQAKVEEPKADPEKLPETTAGAVDALTKVETKPEVQEEVKEEAKEEVKVEAKVETKVQAQAKPVQHTSSKK
jgi:hypothetical protein